MYRIISLLIAYVFGLIQSAYIFGSIYAKTDIRQHGSGNLGSTNTLRVLGKKVAIITFVIDILKSVLAIIVVRKIYPNHYNIAAIYAALGVVIGHDFPFYLDYKGGKGIATMIGAVVAFDFTLIPLTITFGVMGLFTGYVSFASLLFATSIPIATVYLGYEMEVKLIFLLIALLAFYQHRGNIVRLLKGNESNVFKKN